LALLGRVGQFAKSTGGAPASQAVTGVGFTPKVLIMWTEGRTSNGSFAADLQWALGWAVSSSAFRSMAMASQDAQASSVCNKRIASKALTILSAAGALVAECDLTSFDSDGWTLSWTTNDANATIIHYIALGGADISAGLINWQSPTSTGNHSKTGAGVAPTFVFSMGVGASNTGPPSTTAGIRQFLGAMTGSGEWSIALNSQDNQATTNTARRQITDGHTLDISNTGSVTERSNRVSLDADGFTLNLTTAPSTANHRFSLCIALKNAVCGSVNKSTGGAPVDQTLISGLSFSPVVYGIASWQEAVIAATTDDNRLGFGASDGTREESGATNDDDAQADSTTDAISSTTKVYVKSNNEPPTVQAEADHTTLDPGGVTVTWSTNDAAATQLCVFGFGGVTTPDKYWAGLSQPHAAVIPVIAY